MRRVYLVIVMLILASLACLGGGDDDNQQQPTDRPVVLVTVTRPPTIIPGLGTTPTLSSNDIFATATYISGGGGAIFATATTSSLGGVVVGPVIPPSNCAVPTGWQGYVVRAGDTLQVLADSIGQTLESIQNANCITDPNSIFVGQTLYLPFLPALVPTIAVTSATCSAPAGWQPYVVRSGDSLSLIAFSIGAALETIQAANCITNPDAIFVGQTIFLPQLPAVVVFQTPTIIFPTAIVPTSLVPTGVPVFTTTPVTTTRPPTFTKLLGIQPTQLRADGALVTTQRTVALDVGVVNDADNVRYFAGTSASDQSPTLIGMDNDPFDGTRVDYTLAEFDNELFFIAVAQNEFGYASSNIVRLIYDPTYNPNVGNPSIAPFVAFDGTTYTLQINTSVNVTWANAPLDATRIDFYYLPNGGTTAVVIGSDTTPNNGALVAWTVPTGVNGQLFGRAVYATRVQDSGRMNVRSQ